MPPTVILIRHAQAAHNRDQAYALPDPDLTPLGEQQCATLHDALRHAPGRVGAAANNIQLIVTSPMRRTLQTTQLALRWLLDSSSSSDEQQQRGGGGGRVAIEARADWQENSDSPCDTGSAIATLARPPFCPPISFRSLLEPEPDDDDRYPAKTGRYAFTPEAIARRGLRARAWLYARPEKVVAVVSHAGFLRVGVCGCRFANADFRVFDFDPETKTGTTTAQVAVATPPGHEDQPFRLVEWEYTREKGGGLGRSEKGAFGMESQRWPLAVIGAGAGGALGQRTMEDLPRRFLRQPELEPPPPTPVRVPEEVVDEVPAAEEGESANGAEGKGRLVE
ncbi:MAG: hypothetical protein M1826_000239 [Phylliscum demangeonii]|nr:MAG: hypothetical protein M1826_000239 [Phylliscum demangeonii]